MNIILTNICNRNCPYCFANDNMEKSNQQFMPFENFKYCLDFLKENNDNKLRILGGEPTLHPNFQEFINLGLEREFKILIFTNGLFSQEILDYFDDLDKNNNIRFLVNINEPFIRQLNETKKLMNTLNVINKFKVSISFNIWHKEFDFIFLKDLIKYFNLGQIVRLGLTVPVLKGNNSYLESKDDIKYAGNRILNQMNILEKHDILFNLDCGFTMCMFPEDRLDILVKCAQQPLKISYCNFVFDVQTNLEILPCFGLSTNSDYKTYLKDFKNEKELDDYYGEKIFEKTNHLTLYDECINCKFMYRKQCCGGCLSRVLNK